EIHVQQDNVGTLCLDSCHAGPAVGGRQNLDSFGPERRPHQPATGLVVVDYQERPAHESVPTLWGFHPYCGVHTMAENPGSDRRAPNPATFRGSYRVLA